MTYWKRHWPNYKDPLSSNNYWDKDLWPNPTGNIPKSKRETKSNTQDTHSSKIIEPVKDFLRELGIKRISKQQALRLQEKMREKWII